MWTYKKYLDIQNLIEHLTPHPSPSQSPPPPRPQPPPARERRWSRTAAPHWPSRPASPARITPRPALWQKPRGERRHNPMHHQRPGRPTPAGTLHPPPITLTTTPLACERSPSKPSSLKTLRGSHAPARNRFAFSQTPAHRVIASSGRSLPPAAGPGGRPAPATTGSLRRSGAAVMSWRRWEQRSGRSSGVGPSKKASLLAVNPGDDADTTGAIYG